MGADTVTAASSQERPRSVPFHRQVLAFARRSLQELLHDRSALFWSLLMPVFFFVLFGLGQGGGGNGRELAALAVSFGFFGSLTVTLVAFAQTLTGDLQVKRYRKLRSLPISPTADLLGRFLAGYLLSVASFAIVVGVGAIAGGRYALRSPISPIVVLVALLLFALVGTSIAVLVATSLHDSGYVLAVSNVVLMGLFFLTGYNGVVPQMAPGPLSAVLNVVPNSLATRIAIYHVVDVGTDPDALSPPSLPGEPVYVLLLAAWAVGLLAVSGALLGRFVYDGDGGE